MSTATADGTTTTTTAITGGQTSTAQTTTQTSGVSEPWAKSWIQPDFSLNHSALDRLPDHLKDMRPTLEKYKGFEDVLVGFKNQQVMAGKKALAPLPPDAPEPVKAERTALLNTINGVPATAKEYGIIRPQDFPEAHWNQGLADKAMAWAHKNSVPPSALKELVYEINVGEVKTALQAQEQNEQKFWAEEDKKFTATINRDNIPSDRASALIEKGALSLGLDLNSEQTKTFLKGSDARLMALRHAIAIGEDKAVTDGGQSQGGDGDPTALAKDAQSNPANPLYAQYWNKEGKFSRSVQEAAIARVNGWLQQAAAKNPPRGRGR